MTTPPDQTRPVKPVSELLREPMTAGETIYGYQHIRLSGHFPDAVALLEEIKNMKYPADMYAWMRDVDAYLAALRHEVAGNGQEIES